MTEIYVNTSDYVYLKVFQAGVPTYADSDPTVTVVDNNGVDLGLHAVSVDGIGVYKTLITLADAAAQKSLTVTWSFTLFGQNATKKEIFQVITPYLSLTQVASKSPVGTTTDDLKMAEQFARFTIDQYTNQNFGMAYKTLESYGQNADVLLLPERIISVDKLYQNGELVVDQSLSGPGPGQEFIYNLEPTDTNYAIRIINDESPNRQYTVNEIIDRSGNFRTLYRYKVTGLYGWEYVPNEIQMAALYLVFDFFCNDSNWKKKYIESMSATDWKVTFDPSAYTGTGNFIVDRLLEPYRFPSMVVI